MKINKELLDELSEQAKSNLRLRQNYDLRTSASDTSQRMLNALEPGTIVPIHRHMESTETTCVLRGSIRQTFYDDNGNLIETFIVEADSDCPMYLVPLGMWHTTECLETGTIIFEAKDGVYEPMRKEDILAL